MRSTRAFPCRCLEKGENRTDLRVMLHHLNDPAKETNFENCVADCNIPVGEVFTSLSLTGTTGVLHVTGVYLNELYYRDLCLTLTDGMITAYDCANFEKRRGQSYLYRRKPAVSPQDAADR